MSERILTKEEKILALETRISECSLLIYINESAIADEGDIMHAQYKLALEDEIINIRERVSEYKEELNKLR